MRSALDATTAHFILRSSIFSFPVVNRIYFRYTRRQRWPESAHTNIHKNKKKKHNDDDSNVRLWPSKNNNGVKDGGWGWGGCQARGEITSGKL